MFITLYSGHISAHITKLGLLFSAYSGSSDPRLHILSDMNVYATLARMTSQPPRPRSFMLSPFISFEFFPKAEYYIQWAEKGLKTQGRYRMDDFQGTSCGLLKA